MVTLDEFKRAFTEHIAVDLGSATSPPPSPYKQTAAPAPPSNPHKVGVRDFVTQGSESAPPPNPYKKDGARVPDFVLMGTILDWNARKGGRDSKLWYLVDRSGAVVRRGGRELQAMARMNQLCEEMLNVTIDIVTLDQEWHRKISEVWAAVKAAHKDVEQLEKVLPAITGRMDTDPDFFGRVNNYLVALTKPESAIGVIAAAAADLKEAEADLRVAVTDLQIERVRDELKIKNEEMEQLKKDIAEAKRIFKSVISIVKQVADMDWKGLATRALDYLEEYAIDKTIEADYEQDLKRLQQELANANAKLRKLTTQKLVDAIEARVRGVEAATTRLTNAQKGLNTAVKELGRYRADAQNELNDSKSTALAGKLLGERGKQVLTIASARSLCDRFTNMSAAVSNDVSSLATDFGTVFKLLQKPAESDPAWGTARMSAEYDRVNLKMWADHSLKGRQNECSKARKWLDENGAKGPMAPFDDAIALIHQALSKANKR
jgi:hypothetical protein